MTMSLAGRRRPGPAGGPVANLEGLWSGATVGAQIGEAIATLMALPDRERDWLMSCRSRWPTPKAAPGDDLSPAGRRRRSPPTPGAIDRMLPTLLWIRELDEAGQRVLWMRGLGMSWARIGAEIGRSGQTARRWHDAALELIAARLNRRMQAQSLARAQASAHSQAQAQAPSGPARR
ncbi:MAG: DUF6362 family protein [Sneathiellaceae bacterium]